MSLPKFLIKQVPKQQNIRRVRELLAGLDIYTVCESAKCPNIGECFCHNTLTFMVLGNICTRNCKFCGVQKGQPLPVDPNEPAKIAQAVQRLGLDYIVITSVTRDDLKDGGASHFARVIKELNPLKVEVLIPDFLEHLPIVLAAKPFVLNHNIETVPRLYSQVRPQANYQRSLELLKQSKLLDKTVYTKSGFMVGLGENQEEVLFLLEDLKTAQCDMVTIGQYLAPAKTNFPVQRYVEPEEFENYQRVGAKLGLKVKAGPFVRSSYQAKELI